MAFDSVPWFIGGGAIHSPAVARNLAYDAMGGAEGVTEVADLKVLQLAVAGTSVRVSPGGCALKNRYAGGEQQIYTARNTSDINVAIAATGSGSGRSDMVIVRIDDPGYGGQIPADRTVGPYVMATVVSNVNPAYTKASQLGLTYPAIALARIDIPAATGSITAAMIKDVRKVARPRRQSYVDIAMASNGAGVLGSQNLSWSGYANFCRSTAYEVPDWATKAKIIITASGLCLKVGNAFGTLRPVFGGNQIGLDTTYDENWAGAAGGYSRSTYVLAGEVDVPIAWRGTMQYAYAQSKRDGGPGYLTADGGTTMVFQIEFLEVAE